MLRTISPNISIITNLGCRFNCWYCIWNSHKLKNVQLETDWDNLERFLEHYRYMGKVSVSGGGDCLYLYEKYRLWWERLFEITDRLQMLVDVHTREKFVDNNFWERINKCVFSSDRISEDVPFLGYVSQLTKLRITHLVTHETTDEIIDEFLRFQQEVKCQFTIKQIIGFDDKGRYREIRNKYPDIFYLDEGDYNIYYMPDNTVTIDTLQPLKRRRFSRTTNPCLYI